MRLPKDSPFYAAVGGDDPQLCQGELIRWRQLSGICNDIRNPRMGSAGALFARNVQFEATYPDISDDQLARNRHGDRLALLRPDPQLISRKLFTRAQSDPSKCRDGQGLPGNSVDAHCDYQKAPFFNVLAAFWIQYMTHDWFSHMEEGHNENQWMSVGLLGRFGQARLPARGPNRPRLRGRSRCAAALHSGRWHEAAGACLSHPCQQQHRLVGCLADLWLQRGLAPAREARPGRAGEIAAASRLSWRRRRGPGPVARVRGDRPHPAAMGRPGRGRLPGQLERRRRLLPNGVLARAQRLCRRVPPPRCGNAGRRQRPARPRQPDGRDQLPRRVARRAVRGGPPRRRRRDRQDPHHRVDAAAALRRASLPRHERQLGRAVRRPSLGGERTGGRCGAELRQEHRCQEGRPVVLGPGLGPGHLRPGRAGLQGRPLLRPPRCEEGRQLGPGQPRACERRRQPLRLALQLPRGVRQRLPPACPGARPYRAAPLGPGPQPHRRQGARHRDLPRQGPRLRWPTKAWPTGHCRWAASAWAS